MNYGDSMFNFFVKCSGIAKHAISDNRSCLLLLCRYVCGLAGLVLMITGLLVYFDGTSAFVNQHSESELEGKVVAFIYLYFDVATTLAAFAGLSVFFFAIQQAVFSDDKDSLRFIAIGFAVMLGSLFISYAAAAEGSSLPIIRTLKWAFGVIFVLFIFRKIRLNLGKAAQ